MATHALEHFAKSLPAFMGWQRAAQLVTSHQQLAGICAAVAAVAGAVTAIIVHGAARRPFMFVFCCVWVQGLRWESGWACLVCLFVCLLLGWQNWSPLSLLQAVSPS